MENSNTKPISSISKIPTTKKAKNKKWFKLGTRFAIVPETLLLDEKVSSTDKLVIVALALHHNFKSGTCTPSSETISNISGLSKNKVSEAIARLKKSGWVKTQRRGSTSSQYILQDPHKPIEALQNITTPKSYEYKTFNNDESYLYDDEPF